VLPKAIPWAPNTVGKRQNVHIMIEKINYVLSCCTYINVNINTQQRTYRHHGMSGANRVLRMLELITHMGNNATFSFLIRHYT